MIGAEIRAVNSDGTYGEVLPDWSELDYQDVPDDVGAVTLAYPIDGVNAGLITPTQEFSLWVNGVPLPNDRFRLDQNEGDPIKDTGPYLTWAGQTIIARLQTAVLTAPGESGSTGRKGTKAPQTHNFEKASPGKVVRTLLSAAKDRGACPEITMDFSDAKDSAGNAWTQQDQVTNRFEVGSNVLEAVRWLKEQEKAEARMVGRRLQLFRTLPTEERLAGHATLVYGKNLKDGPRQASGRDMVNAVYCVSDTGLHGWVVDEDLVRRDGRVEGLLTAKGVKQWDVLVGMGRRYIGTFSTLKEERTYGVVLGKGADPYVDFQIGDVVHLLEGEAVEPVRVQAITLEFGAPERSVVASVTVKDRIDSTAAKTIKGLQSLLGSTKETYGGVALVASPPTPNTLLPATVPPPQPEPVSGVVTRASTAEVSVSTWDVTGAPIDFDAYSMTVHVGSDADFEPDQTTYRTAVVEAATIPVAPAAVDSPSYVKTVLVENASGVAGVPSDPVEFLVTSIVSADLEPALAETIVPTIPPAASPEITVHSGPTSLVVRSDTVAPTTLIQYEIAGDNAGVPGTWEVFGDPTRATVLLIPYLPSTGQLLAQNTTYWVRATATNGVAPDPAPSTAKSGQLNVDAVASEVLQDLVAGFILAGTIQVGNITIDANTGITIPQPGGVSIVFPVDGSRAQVRGPGADLDSLSVTGPTELKGTTAVSDNVTLNASVVAPGVPPTLSSNSYPSLTPLVTLDYGGNYAKSLTDSVSGTSWVLIGSTEAEGIGVYSVNKTTRAVTNLQLPGQIHKHVVRIGLKYLVGDAYLSASQWRYRIRRYDSAGALEATIYDELESLHNFQALGTNGTQLLAFTNNTGGQSVRRYNITTGAHESTRTLASAFSGVRGVYEGSADFGGNRIVIAGLSGDGRVFVHDPADGGWLPNDSWPGGSSTPYGLHWDGTRFWSVTTAGTIFSYSTHTGADTTVTASQTLTDGTAETAKSPASGSVTRVKRGWYNITATTPPTSPAGLYPKVYASASGSRRLQTLVPALSTSNFSGFLEVLDTGSTIEPAAQVGTFAAGGIGKIAASTNGFEVTGSSGGSVGTGAFRDSVRDAVTTGGEAWRTVGAVGQPAFQNSWTAHSEDVQFCKDGAGNVHIRGRCNRGTATSGLTVFTLPAGYRPVGQNLDGIPAIGANQAIGNAVILTTGEVRFYWPTNANWFSAPICFRP